MALNYKNENTKQKLQKIVYIKIITPGPPPMMARSYLTAKFLKSLNPIIPNRYIIINLRY